MADSPDPRTSFVALVRPLEEKLGIKPGFLNRLLDEPDDWSFVIKLASFVETALSHVLTEAIGRVELDQLIASLQMTDDRRGKLGLAKRLYLIDTHRVKFFKVVARMRNGFVHDVRGVDLRIETWVNSLPAGEHSDVWRSLLRGYTVERYVEDPKDGQLVSAENFAKTYPRFAVWTSAIQSLSLLYQATTKDEAGRKLLIDQLTNLQPLRTSTPKA
jgi:hypothetical protein